MSRKANIKYTMKNLSTTLIIFLSFVWNYSSAQNVPILHYSLNNFSQVQLEIDGSADQYYLLHTSHGPDLGLETITSLTFGTDGNMIVSEPLAAFSEDSYYITAHSIADPDDSDGDGIDDITEYNDMPSQSTLNYAPEIPFVDGTVAINSHEVFSSLAVVTEEVFWAPFLNNQEFVKFAILNQDTDNPEVYFINSETHFIHDYFLATIGSSAYDSNVEKGEIVFNPNEISANGAIGTYSFNYSFGDAEDFETTRRTFELLAANMPFLQNNLQHFISSPSEDNFIANHQSDYVGSRIKVVLESEYFADVDYIPFHQAEGYGFFRHMDIGDNPGSRDIVLYDALPNSLPRVGGIITSVVQTPLSHVNLRAIQDNLPNSFISNPLEIDSIANLLEKFIYYKVEQDRYTIREATQEEVNAWYEDLRPTVEQIPERDLSQTKILPLDDIQFEMSNAFGAKCSNVATMRTFGFPDGTIPNGFGVPFYFYDEFMKFNGFYDKAEEMLSDPEFIADLETRIDMLKDFRTDIKEANMPQWMLDELEDMHDSFPEGTSVRCRSSTNNEDLPGFSGAGLYTSKTQHPEEGHIKKSIKQVYASMWNFRAYDEREFYRVDHFIAAMGVLCHPNYDEEKSNGVGVSIDPLYQTEGNFYINTQVGEFLITNPDANSIPEEILLSQDPEEGYFVIRNSNLTPVGELVMEEEYLDLLREYLQVIHDEFAILYDVVGAEGFGMDIEYKVTAEDQLIIKQARPWVSFWASIKSNFDLATTVISEPQTSSDLTDSELVSVVIANQGLEDMSNFELSLAIDDVVVEILEITDVVSPFDDAEFQFTIPQDFSEIRAYEIEVITSHPMDGYDKNDTLSTVVRKQLPLDADLDAYFGDGSCGDAITAIAVITNQGDELITTVGLEVFVNGTTLGIDQYEITIASLTTVNIPIKINSNLQATDNEITVNLVEINGEVDANLTNNSASFDADLSTTHDYITFVINPDNWPQETSWSIINQDVDLLVDQGGLSSGDELYSQDICVNYEACYSLVVFDSYGDGICCGFGDGNFFLLDNVGDTLAINNGIFEMSTEEEFCLGDPVSTSDELLYNEIIISPNPTDDNFVIKADLNFNLAGDYRIEIYDNLGRQIQSVQGQSTSNHLREEISLQDHDAGYYFIKCYFGDLEKIFKIIKI